MKTSILVALLLVALAASNIGWFIFYKSNMPVKASSVKASECKDLEEVVNKLVKRVQELEDNNTNLLLKYNKLVERYNKLVDLVRTANETLRRSIALLQILASLNDTITSLYDYTTLHAYYSPRITQLVTPSAVGELVISITGSPVCVRNRVEKDLKLMYEWVAKNIAAVPDQYFAVVKELEFVNISGKLYPASIKMDIVRNYIQSPSETLSRRAGDCEDIAILLTSMYQQYLDGCGKAWVLCLVTNTSIDHCFTIAYVGSTGKYLLADPVYGFYQESKSPGMLVESWLNYMGLKSSDVESAILFNNKMYREDTLQNILGLLAQQKG